MTDKPFTIEEFKFDNKDSGFSCNGNFYSAKSLYKQVEKEKCKKDKFYLKQFVPFDRWGNQDHYSTAKTIKRIKSCDKSIPIILSPEGYIVDGNHRIVKAILDNDEYIWYYKLKKYPKPTE